MKEVVALLFLFLGSAVSAQTIDWSKSTITSKTDSIAKTILEPAQYLITYTYQFASDAAYPKTKRKGHTILQVGNRYNRFCDSYKLRFDSICDEVSRGNISVMEASPLMLSALKKARFEEGILIDKQTNKETIQRTAGLSKKYQYKEDCPTLKWEMLERDTVIAGYHCNKARTSLFGRDYIAWYSPEVDMPYGPYKFNGLPGLVFQVVDTQENFEFILDGLQKADKYVPIYVWSSKEIVKTNRKTVRQIYKNFCADPLGALLSSGNVRVSDEAKANVKSKPYNPIELE